MTVFDKGEWAAVKDSTALDTPRQRAHNWNPFTVAPLCVLMWASASPNFHGLQFELCDCNRPLRASGGRGKWFTRRIPNCFSYTNNSIHYTLTSRNKRGAGAMVQWLGALGSSEDLGSIPSIHMAAHTSLHGNFGWWGTADQARSLQAMQMLYPRPLRHLWFTHLAILWLQPCRSWDADSAVRTDLQPLVCHLYWGDIYSALQFCSGTGMSTDVEVLGHGGLSSLAR